jgi:acyl-CoA thioester hydrolase
VRAFSIDYKRPAHYDDELEIQTTIALISPTTLEFNYTTLRDQVVLNTARTTLVFVNALTQRPMRCPDELLPFFQ